MFYTNFPAPKPILKPRIVALAAPKPMVMIPFSGYYYHH